MARNAVTVAVPKSDRGRRLDEVLAARVPEHTRSQLQKLVRRGRVLVDGRAVHRSNGRVNGGERVSITLELAGPEGFAVLHEDDELVVVDKAPGLLVHGNERTKEATLADELERRHGPLPSAGGANRPGIVHRLDRETSGVLVAALTADALADLKDQFRAREVEKTYLAVVHGVPEGERFEVERAIAPDDVSGGGVRDRCRLARDGDPDAKPAHTRFELVESWGSFSLIRCFPSTGRRHQLRLHLLAEHLPIVGDKLYGAKDATPLPDGTPRPNRHALHALELAFDHPTSGERARFRADPPADLRLLMASLRAR